jgi:hypothetical protein
LTDSFIRRPYRFALAEVMLIIGGCASKHGWPDILDDEGIGTKNSAEAMKPAG